MLEIKNLIKKFGEKFILHNISLTIQPGEIAILVGPSGVGKSTLLRIMNNLETLDQGTILLDQAPLDLKHVNKTHHVGMVFQQFNLFEHLTTEQNITLALEKAAGMSARDAKARAHELLERYQLADKASASVTSLSGGQKQRLAIVRTIALKPRVICMDEPTSALDPLLTTYVAKSMEKLAHEGFIILAASHDTELLKKLSCTIYLLQDGKILEKAQSQDLWAHRQKYPHLSAFIAGEEVSHL